MKSTTKVKQVNFNINIIEGKSDDVSDGIVKDSKKLSLLIKTLRNIADDSFFENKKVHIPFDCEKYGFVKGNHSLGQMLYFLADMLE